MTILKTQQPGSTPEAPKSQELIRRYLIQGERRLSNYWWALVIFIGSTGFVLTGLSSFFLTDIPPFINSTNIVFFPQGLLMMLYGSLGFILTIYWSLVSSECFLFILVHFPFLSSESFFLNSSV